MNTQLDPTALALKLALRSNSGPANRYQMGAVIVEKGGRILSWGWNHPVRDTSKRSIHAEEHALSRANPKRLANASIYIAGLRTGTGRVILARPCMGCSEKLHHAGVDTFVYTTHNAWLKDAPGMLQWIR